MRFLKGHGTRNDFVLLPDPDGALGEPSEDLVRELCDRRAGIGADGVIRVVRTEAYDDPWAVGARDEATWFMDYRNADGSVSEMCGNGVRVLGRYLVEHEGHDPARPLPIGTRGGIKTLRFAARDGDPAAWITVDMGAPEVLGHSVVSVADGPAAGAALRARHVDMGNPHAVAYVADLADAGALTAEPAYDRGVYFEGVNVEFVRRVGARHVAMRVHERGSGETWSCGTGACAVMVATALEDGQGAGAEPYTVDLPGGTLEIEWTGEGRVLMSGPAVLVAEGWFRGGSFLASSPSEGEENASTGRYLP
ncbi:diaminopimelate epimerase [Nocardioidaceae bacterium]|nr:diaminopimelate epimerase [Nocardioidaceae bacterium]